MDDGVKNILTASNSAYVSREVIPGQGSLFYDSYVAVFCAMIPLRSVGTPDPDVLTKCQNPVVYYGASGKTIQRLIKSNCGLR